MKTKSLILITALVLWPTLALHASVDATLTLDLKCYTQQSFTSYGVVDTGHVATLRLDSKQLLYLLGKQLNHVFANGSQLKIAVNGNVYVADPKGTLIQDVSEYIYAKIDDQPRLVNGQRNRSTDREYTQNYFPITLTIDLMVLQATVKGIMLEKLSVTAADRFGVHRITDLSSSTINGSGIYNGKLAYFDGSLKLRALTASILDQ